MMDAKIWLGRGFWLRKEKEQLERLREETYTRLTKTTPNMAVEATSGSKDPHKYDILAALDVELEEKIKALDKVRLEIFTAIQQLPDRRYRMVLLGRYYECLSWGEIATLMHYERRYVFKIHGQALQAIQPIIQKGEGLNGNNVPD